MNENVSRGKENIISPIKRSFASEDKKASNLIDLNLESISSNETNQRVDRVQINRLTYRQMDNLFEFIPIWRIP